MYFLLTWLMTAGPFTGARADLFATPKLSPRPYASLGLPQDLPKTELVWALRFAADWMLGRGYVDFGEMSDFMHGHVLRDERLRTRAILFHTQEFPHLRASKNYVYRGRTLDPFERSWLMWLASGSYKYRLSRAADFQRAPAVNSPSVVTADMLSPIYFGDNPEQRQITFFFFRTSCARSEETNDNTRFHVYLSTGVMCLDLVSDACRASFAEGGSCGPSQALAKVLVGGGE